MEMAHRIFDLRKSVNLNQESFGKRIGVTRSAVCNYENGSRSIGEQVILAICREFDVNESWLRTGKGDMFIDKPETHLDELAQEYILDELDRQMILGYLNLSVSEREVVKRYMQSVLDRMGGTSRPHEPTTEQNQHTELTGKQSTPEPDFPIPEGSTPEIEAEVARIREELILEKSMKTSWESTPAGAG